ncbi:YfeK family protein [Leptospira sp. 201903070]|uniref:YfeK family protein n=1 Tax=Leptospira ainlahdjerensis TaxID=2810033 RepID=A0ABS2UA86_9LEPT|nr:YfeK family protein [Leptospira ainlahdjerensis]MBM9576853.1 YfeK family protein [Leptospira ainlahdjerensis]
MKKKLIWLLISLLSFSIGAEDTSNFQNDLNLLMNSLESCECKFIRNGAEHDPKEAREHMERKLKATDGKIQTIPSFIEYIGSKSSVTGKPYLVKFADGKTIESAVWLKGKWEEISKKKNEPAKTPKNKKK